MRLCKRRAAAMLFAFGLLSISNTANAQTPAAPITLWQGLQTDMTPETVAPLVTAMQGVKKVKVIAERKSEPTKRLDINFDKTGIQIADLPFELVPRFTDGKLTQVWLGASSQCASIAVGKYNALSTGLSEKYGVQGAEQNKIDDGDLATAQLSASRSNTKSTIATYFRTKDVVALLTMQVWTERAPPYPGSGSKFVYSLWKLSKAQFESRQAECNGTGDERVDLRIGYMTAAEFDQRLRSASDSIQNEADQTREKL